MLVIQISYIEILPEHLQEILIADEKGSFKVLLNIN